MATPACVVEVWAADGLGAGKSGSGWAVPSAQHHHDDTACHAAERLSPATAVDGGQRSRNDLDLSAQDWPSEDQPASGPPPLQARRMVKGFSKLTPTITQRWPRTGSARKVAIRCPNASSPGCSDAPPAAGYAPGSPKHGKHPDHPTQ
jgi:hypothetical protein